VSQIRLPPEQQAQLCSYLREAVGRSMFSGAMTALTVESNSSAQAELLGLLWDIYFKLGLSGLSSAPKEVSWALKKKKKKNWVCDVRVTQMGTVQ